MTNQQTDDDGFQLALETEALVEGSASTVVVGGSPVALFRVRDRIYATSQICPHAAGPIASGPLEGTRVTCPYHGWEFDVATGACTNVANTHLPTYPVRVVDGQVWVKVS